MLYKHKIVQPFIKHSKYGVLKKCDLNRKHNFYHIRHDKTFSPNRAALLECKILLSADD